MPSHFQQLTNALITTWGEREAHPLLEGSYLSHDTERYWHVDGPDGREIVRWECRRFPGCNSLIVTTQMEIREDLRGQGLGKYLRKLQHTAYKRAGFVGEINTVRADNEAQNNIMRDMCCISMGAFPSDHGGQYRLWLTKLADGLEPVNVPVGVLPPTTVPVVAPIPAAPALPMPPLVDRARSEQAEANYQAFAAPLSQLDAVAARVSAVQPLPGDTLGYFRQETDDSLRERVTKNWSHRK